MAEAEDVLNDVARHATVYVSDLWRRNRPAPPHRPLAELADVAQRLDFLIAAVFRTTLPIRPATPPARRTLLRAFFERGHGPQPAATIPATDDTSIWLPRQLDIGTVAAGIERYRVLALQQVTRATRGSATGLREVGDPLVGALYLVLEAAASDAALVRLLPGMAPPLNALRADALAQRPTLSAFPHVRRPLEELLRKILATDCHVLPHDLPALQTPGDSVAHARILAAEIRDTRPESKRIRGVWLLPDLWTGELRTRRRLSMQAGASHGSKDDARTTPPRSARMERRPEVREPEPDEDENKSPGTWMIQTGEPLEHAEDPIGMQRPTDRDESTAAEEFADSLSELREARLVTTPGSPKEVLLSDDPPEARVKESAPLMEGTQGIVYPEWDYRTATYRDPGARVIVAQPVDGDMAWVERTLVAHRAMLDAIRRRFEMLRAQRMRLRKQTDGEEIDLDAYIESFADYRAGRPLSQHLYQSFRPARRDTAIALLIDISGSTDGWVSAHRRIIDVEREALLLVCLALESMGEPYTVQGFSGDGPDCVTVKTIKTFDEPYGDDVARRIAGLEPERYTRAGAAIRHTTMLLMRKPARHRLLLLLSDGKPNDVDEYEGRYGVEDMRQAVTEAKLQGISPFCLTIDRQAAGYLPQVFGEGNYALLMKPETLPAALIDWIRRLMAH
jgi:nitric oxide reductase NorD protein